MFTTPLAPLKPVLKERLALGGGPVPPDIVERPLLRLLKFPLPISLSNGIPWTLRSRQPITSRLRPLAYLVETSLSVPTSLAYIPTLPVVPNMPSNKWFLTTIAYTITATGIQIVIQTDIACHLWMRETTTIPKEHAIQREKRGVLWMMDKYYCFDVYEDNEQEEAGDTIEHTFIKEPWPVCETRYFYFHGEISGTPSPSTTCILSKHRVAPEVVPVTEYFYPDAHPEVSSVDGQAYREAAASSWSSLVTGAGTHAYDGPFNCSIHIWSWAPISNWLRLTRSLLVFDTTSLPIGATIISASLDIYIKLLRDWLNITPGIVITPSSPASHTAIVPADYQTVTPTLLSDIIPWGDFILNDWKSFPFTPAGLLAVTPGGWTKLAVRSHPYDVLNQVPPWTWYTQTELQFRSADSEFARRPKLTVTYLP